MHTVILYYTEFESWLELFDCSQHELINKLVANSSAIVTILFHIAILTSRKDIVASHG